MLFICKLKKIRHSISIQLLLLLYNARFYSTCIQKQQKTHANLSPEYFLFYMRLLYSRYFCVSLLARVASTQHIYSLTCWAATIHWKHRSFYPCCGQCGRFRRKVSSRMNQSLVVNNNLYVLLQFAIHGVLHRRIG